MKSKILILSLLTPVLLHSQNITKYNSTMNFLKKRGIKLNTVIPPPGFKVYYNCDSLLFMRGNFRDTIKIWTSAGDSYESLDNFKEIIKNKSFGITEFAQSIDDDGRIYVSTYHQTAFIYRNDSLFELVSPDPTASEPINIIDQYFFKKQIDKKTYEARLRSFQETKEKTAVFTTKLIFTKKMFQNKKEVTPSGNLNFEGDTLVLENKWTENGKTCYVIRINNKLEDGQKTSYAYAIDENMRFVQWEGCNVK